VAFVNNPKIAIIALFLHWNYLTKMEYKFSNLAPLYSKNVYHFSTAIVRSSKTFFSTQKSNIIESNINRGYRRQVMKKPSLGGQYS